MTRHDPPVASRAVQVPVIEVRDVGICDAGAAAAPAGDPRLAMLSGFGWPSIGSTGAGAPGVGKFGSEATGVPGAGGRGLAMTVGAGPGATGSISSLMAREYPPAPDGTLPPGRPEKRSELVQAPSPSSMMAATAGHLGPNSRTINCILCALPQTRPR
ncbi:hypothetical protein CHELA40_12105 [Chelatococcus asaccharovorans]|nr:hypothetical protein CHELA40_12105 [Chelatococcus asaccharovorans]CAH1683437.1 hypothetical protein CHELA17_63499 [Chelatococcus asaccharovorans]